MSSGELPPSYEAVVGEPIPDVIAPSALILAATNVVTEDSSTALYRVSQDLASLPHDTSSLKLYKVVNKPQKDIEEKKEDAVNLPIESQSRHLYYLVHPKNAEHRDDIAARYYLTSPVSGVTGNIKFNITKSKLQKTEFSAMQSPGRSAAAQPLFDDNGLHTLFTVKTPWAGGRHRWFDSAGKQVAREDARDGNPKLLIEVQLQSDKRDALVALWILKLWHDRAESPEAKRRVLERLSEPTHPSDMAFAGAAGSLGGSGANKKYNVF